MLQKHSPSAEPAPPKFLCSPESVTGVVHGPGPLQRRNVPAVSHNGPSSRDFWFQRSKALAHSCSDDEMNCRTCSRRANVTPCSQHRTSLSHIRAVQQCAARGQSACRIRMGSSDKHGACCKERLWRACSLPGGRGFRAQLLLCGHNGCDFCLTRRVNPDHCAECSRRAVRNPDSREPQCSDQPTLPLLIPVQLPAPLISPVLQAACPSLLQPSCPGFCLMPH